MSIEGIAQEHFNALSQTEINKPTTSCTRHALFYYYLSDDSKQYAAITTAKSKCLIELFKKKSIGVIIK